MARSVLETGGDVVCIDLAKDPPLPEEWGKKLILFDSISLDRTSTPLIVYFSFN